MSHEDKPIGFICGSDSFHPYECGGDCVHCRQEKTELHNPTYCYLCNDGENYKEPST